VGRGIGHMRAGRWRGDFQPGMIINKNLACDYIRNT
jgi:hypothetical protein